MSYTILRYLHHMIGQPINTPISLRYNLSLRLNLNQVQVKIRSITNQFIMYKYKEIVSHPERILIYTEELRVISKKQ